MDAYIVAYEARAGHRRPTPCCWPLSNISEVTMSISSASSVDASATPLHFAFFPLMSPGHMIPAVDMACLFALRGVRCTIITTPANAANARRAIDASVALGRCLSLVVIPFPDTSATGLAPGKENLSAVPTKLFGDFVAALPFLRAPFADALQGLCPDVLISDSLFPWAADVAEELGITHLIFHGCGAFPLVVISNLLQRFPITEESFVLEGLPDIVRLHRGGLPDLFDNIELVTLTAAAEQKSFGIVMNTYREMEPWYVDQLKTDRRAWCVGPVSLGCRMTEEERREPPVERSERIMTWLGRRPARSVVYVCFGSLCHVPAAQLAEIAKGLEASGHAFLWVIRQEAGTDAVAKEVWMPEGFEERVAGRGLVLRGWAPQTAVLEHEAVGWFLTHCGWNSLQEAMCAGVPVLTWPLFHEQFINEALLVDVMRVGMRVWEGLRRRRLDEGDGRALVSAEEVAGAVERAMGGGEEAEAARRRARHYGEMARAAVEEGGSTYEDATSLIAEMETQRANKVRSTRKTQM